MKRVISILIAACCWPAVADAEIKVACKPACCGKDQATEKTAESQERPQELKDVDAKAIAKEIKKDTVKPCGCSSCCDSGSAKKCCDSGGCAAAPSCCDSGCRSKKCGKCCSKRTCSTSCGTECGGCYTSTDLGLGRFLGCGGGASCCCPQCCPGWTAVGEVLFLSRSNAEGLTLITDQNTGDEMLNVKDFDFDFNGAPRLFIRHENACCIGFELGYMGLDSWNDVALRGGPISPTLVGPGGIPFPSSAPGNHLQRSIWK